MGQASVLIREAEVSMKDGDYDCAIEKFQAAKAEQEPTPELFSQLARACALRGRYLTVLQVYLEWARSALLRGEFEQAEEAVGYALALRPDSPEAHLARVEILRVRGDKEELLERLLELSYLYLEKGQDEESVPFMQEAVELCPENLELPLKLAEVYVSVGRIGLAETGFRRSINLFLDAGEAGRTLEPLRRLRILRPEDTQVMLELGTICLDLNSLDEAEEQFRSILKLDIGHQEALLSLATVCERKGRFRNGILALNKVLQLDPESAKGLRRMGDLQRAAGDLSKASEAYHKAAAVYLEQGRKVEAGEAFQAVLWMDANDAAAQNGLHSLGIEPVVEEPAMPEAELTSPMVEEPAPERERVDRGELQEESQAEESPLEVEPVERFSRPRMVRKAEFETKRATSKPLFKKRGPRRKTSLREGLDFKTDSSGEKPMLPYRGRRAESSESLELEPVLQGPKILAEESEEPGAERNSLEHSIVSENVVVEEPEATLSEPQSPFEPEPTEPGNDPYQKLFDPIPEPELRPSLIDDPVIDQADEQEAEVLSIFDWPSDEGEQAWPELDEPQTPVWEESKEEQVEVVRVEDPTPVEGLFPSFTQEEEAPEVEEELGFDFDFDVDLGWDLEEDLEPIGGLVEKHSDEIGVADEIVSESSAIGQTVDPEVLFPVDGESIFDGFEDWGLESAGEESSPSITGPAALALSTTLPSESGWSKPADLSQVENERTNLGEEADLVEESSQTELPEVCPTPIDVPLPEEVQELDLELSLELTEEKDDSEPEPVGQSFKQLRESVIAELATDQAVGDLSDILAQTLPITEAPTKPAVAQEKVEMELPVEDEPLVEPEPAALPETSEKEFPEGEQVPQDAGEAIVYYRNCLSQNPGDEKMILRLADCCLQFGLIPEALHHYQSLQRVNPGSVEVGQRLIKAALWLEDYPTVRDTLLRVARLQFAKGDLVGCQDHLGDLLSLEPEHKEARQLMVDVFLASDQEKLAAWHLSQMVERWAAEEEWESATQALVRLGQIAPCDTVKERLAVLHRKQGQDEEALRLLRELREQYDSAGDLKRAEDVAYRILRSEARTAGDRKRLIELLEKQDLMEEASSEKFALAVELRAEGALEEAGAVLKELDQTDSLEIEQLLVEVYLEAGKLTLAEHHAESLAERFMERKAYQQAISLFESWSKAEPSSAKTRERLAQFYQLGGDINGAKLEWLLVTETHEAQGDMVRAVRSLERALELDPDQWDWRLRLARLRWERLGHPEGALAELRVLFSRRPDWDESTKLFVEVLTAQNRMSELGEVLTQLENTELGESLKAQTLESLKAKLQARSDDYELQFAWGELCYGLGSLDLAIEQFQKLRRLPEYRLRSYQFLGHCFSKKKGFNMVELALSQFRKGVALSDEREEDRAPIRCDMARLLIEKGRLDEAEEQLRLARPWLENTDQVDRLLSRTERG